MRLVLAMPFAKIYEDRNEQMVELLQQYVSTDEALKNLQQTSNLASFPDPVQFSVTCSMERFLFAHGEPGNKARSDVHLYNTLKLSLRHSLSLRLP